MRHLQVVKIGTNSVFHDGSVDYFVLSNLGYDLAKLSTGLKTDSVLVVSGAIALGMKEREIEIKPKQKEELQRCAGVGQPILMKTYDEGLKLGVQRYADESGQDVKLITRQYEVTYHNLDDTTELRNIQDGLRGDLKAGILPLINYNDGIDPTEIERDNDNLAARITKVLIADRLVILTDKGLTDRDDKLVKIVYEVNDDVMALCRNGEGVGTGRMRTKLEAAKMLLSEKIPTIIGDKDYGLCRLIYDSEVRTIIRPKTYLDVEYQDICPKSVARHMSILQL